MTLFRALRFGGLALLLCLALPAWAAAPVWIDEDTVVDPVAAPNVTSLTVSVTVSAGSNTALVFSVSSRSSTATVTGCTFNTTENATFLDSELNGSLRHETWGLLNPTVTTANAVCTFSGALTGARLSVHQYDDVGGFGAVNSITGTSTNPSVSVTTTASDSVVFGGIFSSTITASPFTPDAGTTERVDGTTGSGSDRAYTDIEKTVASPGISTVSTTASANSSWSAVAVEILAVAVAGTGTGSLTLLGVGGPGGTPAPPSPDCTIEMAAGSTDAQIIAQLASAPDGSKICIAAGETVLVSSVLQMDVSQRSLTLDCQGSRLQRNKSGALIVMQGSEVGTSAFTVSGNTITWTTVPSGLAVGDWVKLTADDDLPGAQHTSATLRARLGQAVQIASIAGSNTVFSGTLNSSGSYVTNRRGNKIQSKPSTIRRCNILGDPAQTTWVQPSIQVRNAVAPTVEQVQCEQGLAGCIEVTNTVSAVIRDYDCRNLLTSSTNQNYCLRANASWATQASGGYAENTRQPFEAANLDILANAVSLADYGAVLNLSETDTVCRSATGPDGCFGLRSEAQFALMERVYGFDSTRCINARGLDNTLKNGFCINMANGIQLFDDTGTFSGTGDDGIRWLFDRFIVREIDGVGLTAAGSPTQNRICSSRIESYVAAESITDSTNLSSCTYLSGQATLFNSVLASNVANDQENLACQTCDDIIPAGTGNDTIDALGGNDLVWGGPGNDTISLGSGQDRLAYLWTDEDFDAATSDDADTVSDFVVGWPGDIIDVSWFLARAAGADYKGDPFTDGYVRALQSGGDTLIQFDIDGGGNAYVTVATLSGVTASNLIFGGRTVASDNWKIDLIGQ